MKQMITFGFLVELPKGYEGVAKQLTADALRRTRRSLECMGFIIESATRDFRKPTRQEAINLGAKRYHLFRENAEGKPFVAIGGCKRFVKKRYTTSDWNKVSCKQCLKQKPEERVQESLFGEERAHG